MATRKCVIWTLDCKVKVIRQHENGIGSRQLAAEFGVGKTQINNIVTAKADILKLWDDGVNGRRKLVVVRKCPYVECESVRLVVLLGEKVVSSTTVWSHSSDLLNYALSTNNSELIALLSQARDLIQSDCRKAIDSRGQVSITDFFANQ